MLKGGKDNLAAVRYSVNVSIAICIPNLKAYSNMAASPRLIYSLQQSWNFSNVSFCLSVKLFFHSHSNTIYTRKTPMSCIQLQYPSPPAFHLGSQTHISKDLYNIPVLYSFFVSSRDRHPQSKPHIYT